MTTEDHATRLKRLHMRSIRRGIKEMDLILTAFSEQEVAGLSPDLLDLYEEFLTENDQDLLPWITGQMPAPEKYADLLERIRTMAQGVARPTGP